MGFRMLIIKHIKRNNVAYNSDSEEQAKEQNVQLPPKLCTGSNNWPSTFYPCPWFLLLTKP